MALIITTLSRAIDEFRKLYLASSISPETVGFLMQQIVDQLGKIMNFLEGAMEDGDTLSNMLQALEDNSDKLMKWYHLYQGQFLVTGADIFTDKNMAYVNLTTMENKDGHPQIGFMKYNIPAVTSSHAGVLSADMYDAVKVGDTRSIFPACPMLQQEHLLYMKPGLIGYDKIRTSQIDGLGDGTEVIVFELDGTQSISNGVGFSLIFRDTSIVRYKTQISGTDTYDWEFDCVVRQNGQLYTAKVSVITPRLTTNAGYEVRSVRIRKF